MRTLIVSLLALAVPVTPVVSLDATQAPLLGGRHVATFTQARRAFGPSARIVATGGACTASWPRDGLEIRFAASTGDCAPSSLGAWLRVAIGSTRWRTRDGLRVGATLARLHTLYPDATRLPGTSYWRLETGGPLCDGGAPLALVAKPVSGHVGALLVLHVPACG